MLRKCVVYYSAIASESAPLEFDLSNMGKITQNQIMRELYPVLRSKERFDLQASQSQVKAWLAGLLKLEDNEWRFLNEFREKKYHPELLFESDEILERIKSHPMAIRKCS